jgi:hypothetical protein
MIINKCNGALGLLFHQFIRIINSDPFYIWVSHFSIRKLKVV